MKIKTKHGLKLAAYLTLALALGVGAVLGGVKAFQSDAAPKVVVEGDYIEAQSAVPSEDILGAVTSPDILSPYLCVNNDCTYSLSKTITDGVTTTIISFTDPFLAVSSTNTGDPVLRDDGITEWIGASSTVDLARVYVTGAATTSLVMTCGAASSATALPTNKLVTASIGTSTVGVIENNTASTTAWSGISGGSVPKIEIGPSYPYFNCAVATQAAALDAAVTQSGNTFDARVLIRVNRLKF